MILISVTAVAGIGCIIAAFCYGCRSKTDPKLYRRKDKRQITDRGTKYKSRSDPEINIDIGSGDVKLQNGNQDRLIIKKKGSWEPVILKSDGEIEIKQKSRHF